jgi:hypothetical protein
MGPPQRQETKVGQAKRERQEDGGGMADCGFGYGSVKTSEEGGWDCPLSRTPTTRSKVRCGLSVCFVCPTIYLVVTDCQETKGTKVNTKERKIRMPLVKVSRQGQDDNNKKKSMGL